MKVELKSFFGTKKIILERKEAQQYIKEQKKSSQRFWEDVTPKMVEGFTSLVLWVLFLAFLSSLIRMMST